MHISRFYIKFLLYLKQKMPVSENSRHHKLICNRCFLSHQALSGFCGFMAANLYARSIFGEDALANVSIEKPIHLGPEAPVTGHIRIRAKSQVGHSCSAMNPSTWGQAAVHNRTVIQCYFLLHLCMKTRKVKDDICRNIVFYYWLKANFVSFISQGMALSLGDKINLSQKKANIWGHSPPADLCDFSFLLPVSLQPCHCCQVRTLCFFLFTSLLSELYISVTFYPCPVKFSVKTQIY